MVVSIFWEADFVGLENPQFDTLLVIYVYCAFSNVKFFKKRKTA